MKPTIIDGNIVFYKAKGKECVCGVSSFSHKHYRKNLHELTPIIEGAGYAVSVGGESTTTDLKKRFEEFVEEYHYSTRIDPILLPSEKVWSFIDSTFKKREAEVKKEILPLVEKLEKFVVYNSSSRQIYQKVQDILFALTQTETKEEA